VLTVYGAAGVVRDAAESALVAAAVDGRLLGDVNGLRVTAAEGMELFAPPAGAGLYAAYGGVGVALLDAATFVVAAAGFYAPPRVPGGGRQRPGRRAHGPASPSACLASPRPQRPPRAERTCARSSSGASPAW